MSLEIAWMVVPICALLSQIGGTWWKGARRFLIPIILSATIIIFKCFTWNIILFLGVQFAVLTLPFTLIGNSIKEHWLNWLWLPVWGILICTPSIIVNYHIWPAIVICGVILATLGALSNIKSTSKWFQWKFVELFIGIIPATCLVLALTIQ